MYRPAPDANAPSPFAALRPLQGALIAAFAFSLATNLLVLTSPLYMMQVFDRVLTTGNRDTLLWLTVIGGVAFAAYGALEAARSAILSRTGAAVEQALGGKLIEATLQSRFQGGPETSQPLRDLAQVRGFFSGPCIAPVLDAPWTPVFLAILWVMHPWYGMLALGSGAVLFLITVLGETVTKRPLSEAAQHQSIALSVADSASRNAQVVRGMGLLPHLVHRWRLSLDRHLVAQLRASDRTAVLHGLTKFIRMSAQTAVLGLGALLVLQGEGSGGTMIAASILLGRALAPVDQLIGAWRQVLGARAAWSRIRSLLRRSSAVVPSLPLPEPVGDINVERLTLALSGSDVPVLADLSFALRAGETLAVVGPSASGKSTLCRLLMGVVAPTAGVVRLDKADVESWDRVEFGRHVGYLPQDVELFPATIAENICRMEPGDPQKIVEAARLAGVHDLILRLPDGYQTMLDSSGVRLSGGQRQRIGLARALYGNPKLLVLDEPNANLDTEGDSALFEAIIAARARGCTIVLVSHRPHMLQIADFVLVLRPGLPAAFGPTTDVLPLLTGKPQVHSTISR
jgi:PrtD family type I secretion system ABC transporter